MEWQQLILNNSNPLKKKFLKLHFFYVAAILALFWASFLQAEVITWSDPASATFVMKGSYIRVGLSKNGTLGVGSGTKPGLQYDITGASNFAAGSAADDGDYLTPGTPWEIFSVKFGGTNYTNNNEAPAGGDIAWIDNTGVNLTGMGFDNYVRWTGQRTGQFNLQQDIYFNNGDQRINFEITISALSAATVQYLRAIDPDPMSHLYGSTTYNDRGSTGLGVPVNNWVYSTQWDGSKFIFPLGLFSADTVAHNTGVTSPWSPDPQLYLDGRHDGGSAKSDNAIGIAFNLGSMSAGESKKFRFSYIVSGTLADAMVPINSVTVSPGSMDLFVGGTGQASVTVAPSHANQQVTWRSGTNSIATVSSTGVVTGTGFGSTTISAVSDQDASKTDSLTVNVSDPLVFTLSNPTNTFLTGSTAGTSMVVDRGLTVSGASVFGGTVSIVGGFVRVQDVLSATDQGGISGSYNSSTGVLTLSGTATAAQYQSFLRTVTYINTQDSPYVGTRTLRFSLNFGIPVRPIAQEVTFPVNVFGSNQTIFFGTMF